MSVVTLSVKLFSLLTDVQGLLVYHMYVIKECQVVVCIRVLVVEEDALLQVFHSMLIVAHLKVCEAKVVV